MKKLEVSDNIAQAKTISSEFYTYAEYFELSKEKIFAQAWHFIGDISLVPEKNSVYPFTIQNEPLLLSRDSEETINCISNVCTHRGAVLVEKPCMLQDIRCRYHGRRFTLNGEFQSMPEFKEVENFPAESDNLPKLNIFQWGPLLFTSFNNQHSQESFFAEMMERISWMPIQEFKHRPDLSTDYEVNAHWALYCENYLEGFHIPFVHPGLNQEVDYGNYTTEIFKYSNLQLGIAKEGKPCFDLPASSADYGKRVAGYYFWVFPNMMFNFYPWGLSINIITPLTKEKTKVSFIVYVWDESKLEQGAGADLDSVEMEDEEVVESVQRGVRSRFYDQGRYSVKQEKGTHHFHRLIAEFMNRV